MFCLRFIVLQDRNERTALRGDLKRLKREMFERETRTTTSILEGAQVILCTLTGAAMRYVLFYSFM